MKKLLFTRESPCLQPLLRQIEQQRHRTLALWALDCAELYLEMFEQRVPAETRPRICLQKTRAWMRGELKMPEAKAAIHAAHNAATEHEADPVALACGRAIGQAAGAVHVETHAVGLAMYGLTALTYAAPDAATAEYAVQVECARLLAHLQWLQEEASTHPGPWANFLMDDTRPNKELLLWQKINAQPH